MDDAWAKERLAQLKAAAPVKPQRESFVKVSLAAAARAAAATGDHKLLLWLWLLHRSWERHTPTIVVPTAALQKYGITRKVKRRGLEQLQASGLIAVEERPYKNPIVTLLHAVNST
jgi:hypothetical protein